MSSSTLQLPDPYRLRTRLQGQKELWDSTAHTSRRTDLRLGQDTTTWSNHIRLFKSLWPCTPPTPVEETGTLWRSRFYSQLDKGFPDRQDIAGFGWRLHIWQYQSHQLSATRNSPRSSIILDIYQWPPGLCPIKYQAIWGWLHPVLMDKERGRLSDTTRRP